MISCRCDYSTGDVIDDKYQVQKVLGVGSFGNVYKVCDTRNHVFALKLLRLWEVTSDLHDNLVKRFKLEYNTSRIGSDYFVHSYDYGVVEGNPYFTMEYCANGDLSKMGATAMSRLPQIAHDILNGLYDLHAAGLVHRDLKPENVMIKDSGRVALTDFGVVGDKHKGYTLKKWLSKRPQQIFGTYIYMAPEQSDRKGGGVTYLPTTDIFSFGVMMYEILTSGHFPFGQLKVHDDLEKYQENARKEIWNRQLLCSTSEGREWQNVIGRCLRADYRERYQTAMEVMKDIPRLQNVRQRATRSGQVRRLIVTLGANLGAEYQLCRCLTEHKRMIRLGREEDNDIILKEEHTSYISRYHFTIELGADNRTWYIRDGQWHMDKRAWVDSTNGTYLNSSPLTTDRVELKVGDIITVGDMKMLVETEY